MIGGSVSTKPRYGFGLTLRLFANRARVTPSNLSSSGARHLRSNIRTGTLSLPIGLENQFRHHNLPRIRTKVDLKLGRRALPVLPKHRQDGREPATNTGWSSCTVFWVQ